MAVAPGRRFPSVTAATQDNGMVNLDDYRGQENLVVFFYPKATTTGCVRETTEFGQRQADFAALHTKLVGVSVDAVGLQQPHAIQCAATFPLLCDTDRR
jgi:peroxiredoxin Q/BCP